MPCGQLKLISNPSTPTSSHLPTISSHASLEYSSIMDAMRTLQTEVNMYASAAEVSHVDEDHGGH